MRNYWRIILSLFLIGNALSVQAAVKSFTETFVLYTDSEGLTTAYNEGWCLDGKGSDTFGYYSSRSGTFPDPLDDGTITMESDWLDVKGAGNNKGAVFTVTGISGLKLAFQSGSSVTRYVRADISGTSGANITLKGGNDGTEGSMLETSELIPAEQYTITITSWATKKVPVALTPFVLCGFHGKFCRSACSSLCLRFPVCQLFNIQRSGLSDTDKIL